MNESELERLVDLLTYLKKHDDVESELSKKKEPPPGHAAGRRKSEGFTDETQRRLLTALGSTQREGLTDPAVLQARKDARTSVGSGTPGSDPEETSEIPEIPEGTEDSEGIIDPYKEYGPSGDEFGPRGGQFTTVGDTPVEGKIAPEMGSETSEEPSIPDDSSDDSRILDLIRSSGYTFDDVKQALASLKRPKETPIHHIIRSDSNDRITKSSESIVLEAFRLLGM
jgi:hypothetical protein